MLISFDMPISLDILVIPCGIFISPFCCIAIGFELFGVLAVSDSKLRSHSIILDLCREVTDRTAPMSSRSPTHLRYGILRIQSQALHPRLWHKAVDDDRR